MKRGLLFGSLLILLAGCNPTEKLLIRTWKLQDVDFNVADFNLTPAEKPLMVQQMRDSCLFDFKKDHTYSARLTGITDTGTWKLNKAGDSIYTKVGLRLTAAKIKVLNENRFEVDVPSGNNAIKFVLVPR
jgi:hypothetical protein